ncbi:hypothetical protein BR93DRAFT_492196 [Coniochaeta sp. PMI_546]|nr:hypothetical protein BR93DRAFT_492196 [Coniochaeta sp. PMI_546]
MCCASRKLPSNSLLSLSLFHHVGSGKPRTCSGKTRSEQNWSRLVRQVMQKIRALLPPVHQSLPCSASFVIYQAENDSLQQSLRFVCL